MDANRPPMPAELRRLLGDGKWRVDTMGRSGSQVFHIGHGYLKIVPHISLMSLRAEKERMLWLRGRLPVPEVYYYGVDEQNEYLYMSEIPGVMACNPIFRDDMPALIDLLTQALQMMHSVDITDCPFDQRLSYRLALACQGVQQGRIAEQEITAHYPDLTPAMLYERLVNIRSTEEDLVFAHGDFCLPNILLDREHHRVSGFIDLEYAGVADRYRDLERACWSLGYNFSQEWIPALLQAYGLEEVNQEKIKFYAQLNELSWANELPREDE